jgi:hypothetical protein
MGLSVGNCYLQLLSDNKPQKPFNLKVPFEPGGNPEIRDVIKELSALKYGTERAEVEEMVLKKFNL